MQKKILQKYLNSKPQGRIIKFKFLISWGKAYRSTKCWPLKKVALLNLWIFIIKNKIWVGCKKL